MNDQFIFFLEISYFVYFVTFEQCIAINALLSLLSAIGFFSAIRWTELTVREKWTLNVRMRANEYAEESEEKNETSISEAYQHPKYNANWMKWIAWKVKEKLREKQMRSTYSTQKKLHENIVSNVENKMTWIYENRFNK